MSEKGDLMVYKVIKKKYFTPQIKRSQTKIIDFNGLNNVKIIPEKCKYFCDVIFKLVSIISDFI